MLVGPQVRHEARLQRVPGDARCVGAGEVLTELRDIQPHASARERDPLRAVEPRYLRRAGRAQDRAKYEADRAKDIALAGEHGLGAALEANRLDALLFPGWNISGMASRPGYPEIVVPIGMVAAGGGGQNPFPSGFTPQPAPYAAAFVGAACSEPRLVEIAYAFEQATKRRVPPSATP